MTERDRALLAAWLGGGAETPATRRLLSELRLGFPRLAADLRLAAAAARRLRELGRWGVRARLRGNGLG